METTRLWLDCCLDLLVMFVFAMTVFCAYAIGYENGLKERRKYETPKKRMVRKPPRKLHY